MAENQKSTVRTIFNNLTEKNASELVYGEPIQTEDQTVVTVSKVSHSFGLGGGGKGDEQGEGGGGHFTIKPVGVYQIVGENVKFKPIISFKFTLSALLAFGAFLVLLNRKK